MAELDKSTTVTADVPEQTVELESDEPSLPPNTTEQEDLTAEGQRHINQTWEYTQAAITVMITLAAIVCAIMELESQIIYYAFAVVVATYFARTNHTKIGGVPTSYKGR